MLKSIIAAAIGAVALLAAPHVDAQTANGRARSSSVSQSGAMSSSRSGNSNASISIDNPASTTSTSSQRISGTQRIIAAPPVSGPALAAAGIETCLGSVSVGGSFPGGGFSFGSTTKDDDCNRRLFGRQLWNMGYKRAAVAMHCMNDEVQAAMAIAGTPCPGMPVVAAADPLRRRPVRGEILADPATTRYGRISAAPAETPAQRTEPAAPPTIYASLRDFRDDRATGGN